MEKNLFEQLNNMSVDEIINEDFAHEQTMLTEERERPFTIEEANAYFFQEGELTLEEMNTLMENKLKELWEEHDKCRLYQSN